MGGGSWTKDSYRSYSKSMGRSVNLDGSLDKSYTAEKVYRAKYLDPMLNPKNVTRECCDSAEHPDSTPIILALDVTGSMGSACARIAQQLHPIIESLYANPDIHDPEIMVMGIGDFVGDDAPLQVSQFESDIRIAEQLDKIWLEKGGCANGYESYSAAWYFGVYHCKLDCWNRGKKGIIITMGDEALNPYLSRNRVMNVIGDSLECDVETSDVYAAAAEKYDIYHLAVDDPATCYQKFYKDSVHRSFGEYLDQDHLRVVTLDSLPAEITSIVTQAKRNMGAESSEITNTDENGMPIIGW